jgi:hypothetical protein
VDELRAAIIAVLAEQIGMVDMLDPDTQAVLDAWNKMCEASPTVGIPTPITEDDIEAYFD